MRVLVCGATGCVGAAVVHALRARGHKVIEGARRTSEPHDGWHVDYMQPRAPEDWAQALRASKVDAVVNCVGILRASRHQTFERIHTDGPIELFRGAALAGVRCIVQVSALGVRDDVHTRATPYLHSKLLADVALAGLPVEWAVLRPSLVYGPRSQSAALFATLASLPVVSLPGRGDQALQPIHVYELAEAIARLVEGHGPMGEVHEMGGPSTLTYREMLAHYRAALGLGDALWLPVPMPFMKAGATLAEALPQKVFCRDTIRMLERGSVPLANATPALLGRAPTPFAQGLHVTAPEPLIDLQVRLSPALALAARVALAFMWLYTALVSAMLPQASGVLVLLARCGFSGRAGIAALVFSCSLNIALGWFTLRRPGPWLYALQLGAVVGYTLTAALNMPELTLDHCGPLVKNLPILVLVLLLWCAAPPATRAPVRISTGAARVTALRPTRTVHAS